MALVGEKRLGGEFKFLTAGEIEGSFKDTRRQYLTGDLKLPQNLPFILDKDVEVGISKYDTYHWEKPHYHTTANEYCYMLSGETKYLNVADGMEYHFHAGDFYVIRPYTPYAQKCRSGCRLLFVKAPGLNDKVAMNMCDELRQWSEAWDFIWTEECQAKQKQAQEKDDAGSRSCDGKIMA